MKVIRDPVHNIIQFDKDSEKIILDLLSTREFQRLRHIKQLGFSSYTYPGAEHSRFIHSLGVTFLMKRFIEKICSLKGSIYQKYCEELGDNRSLALTAALLHDIGHGPFSHALEKTTKIKHEKWTIEIILGNTEINQILEAHQSGFSREVADVIRRTHSATAVVKLLSSQLDTDRVDYLLRDSLMSGAGYGKFDLEWMINVLRIGEVNGDTEVGLDRAKGQSIAEDFVLARYYMYVNVYFHKTTRGIELVIDKIFDRAMEMHAEGQIEIPNDLELILSSEDTSQILIHYLNLTDSTIWHFISLWKDHPDPILSDLCNRIYKRNLYKKLPSGIQPFTLFERVTQLSKEKSIPANYLLLQDEATSSSYKDPYILHSPKPGEKTPEQEATEQIILFDSKGKGEELSNVSEIIRQIRNRDISISNYYVPEQYLKYFCEGVT